LLRQVCMVWLLPLDAPFGNEDSTRLKNVVQRVEVL